MSAHKDGIWRELYPFQSYVRMLDGHRYHYLDEGKGPVLLMVHGNPTWSFYWRNLVTAFSDRFRVVVPDHIGCGLSDKPQNYPYTLSQHIRNLRWLVEKLDLRDVTLLAHDWGGAIGLGTAVQMPQRFGRFILFNTAAFRDTRCPLRIKMCRTPYLGAFAVRGLNGFARAAITMATEKPERMTAQVKAGLLAPYDSWANRIATHRFVQDIPLARSHPSYGTLASIEAGLAQFKRRPVQFHWGMKDWCFTPHYLERFVDEFFPDAEVNAYEDCGHYIVEDAHERIIPQIEDFLVRHKVIKGKSSPVETWKAPGAAEAEAEAKEAEPPPKAAPRGGGGIRGTAMAYEEPIEPDEVEAQQASESQVSASQASASQASLGISPGDNYAPAPQSPVPHSPPPHSPARISDVAPPPYSPARISDVAPPPLAPVYPEPPIPEPVPKTPPPWKPSDVPPPSPRESVLKPTAPAVPSVPAAEVDEYPFPRVSPRPAPAPAPASPEADEYPFPRMARPATPPAPPTPVPADSPSSGGIEPPVGLAPSDTAVEILLPGEPAAEQPPEDAKPRDPAIGETRLPEGGFPAAPPPPDPARTTPPQQVRIHDPAIGDTRLPEEEEPALLSPPSEAGAKVIRDSGLAEGLPVAPPAPAAEAPAPSPPGPVAEEPAPAAEAPVAAPPPKSPIKKTPAPAGFTPEMEEQGTVMSLKAKAQQAKEQAQAKSPDSPAKWGTPQDGEPTRLTPDAEARRFPARERVPAPTVPDDVVNVALRLRRMAAVMPEALAVIAPAARDDTGKRVYDRITFSQLDRVSDRLARGLKQMGVEPGTRLALMVPPGIQFVALVFGLFKAGVVTILIDPGMGRKNLLKCLDQAEPEGFVGIPLVHQVRRLYFWRFRKARYNVVVGGHKPVAGAMTFDQLRGGTWNGHVLAHTKLNDPAAIIFTTGSTGPPKGVLYRHGNFDAQVDQLQEHYRIRVGEVSLSGFPLFTLFDAAMGVTSVIPDMDPTRPAQVDPKNILEAVNDLHVTQAFASPAMWNTVGKHCDEEQARLPTLRRVLSAGAPVPPHVLRRMQACIPDTGDVHTPYGATEALPVASISARELLPDLAARSQQGAGTCVGKRFSGIEWRVIRIVDGPINTIDDAPSLPQGEIGELVVSGPVVTREYFRNPKANEWGKLAGGEATRSGRLQGPDFWHRMGDVGYLDAEGRFWYCGRMSHRVQSAEGTLYTEPCEAIFNTHPLVYRSALVGVGKPGKQTPVIVLEPHAGQMPAGAARAKFFDEIRELARSNPKTERIAKFLLHPSLPVDIRHNSKIFREKLAKWARWRVW